MRDVRDEGCIFRTESHASLCSVDFIVASQRAMNSHEGAMSTLHRIRTKKSRLRCSRLQYVEQIAGRYAPLFVQHVALPQRPRPIYSFRPSRPTAPLTISLHITYLGVRFMP